VQVPSQKLWDCDALLARKVSVCLTVWLSSPIVLASVTKCCLWVCVWGSWLHNSVYVSVSVCEGVLTSAHNSTRLLATSRADLTDVAYCFILLPPWLMTETAYKSNLSSPNCVCVCVDGWVYLSLVCQVNSALVCCTLKLPRHHPISRPFSHDPIYLRLTIDELESGAQGCLKNIWQIRIDTFHIPQSELCALALFYSTFRGIFHARE